MSKVYRLQNGPFIIYEDGTGKKVNTFRNNTPPYSVCDWVNNCIEDDEVVITNSPMFERLIRDRCKVKVSYEKFDNLYKK